MRTILLALAGLGTLAVVLAVDARPSAARYAADDYPYCSYQFGRGGDAGGSSCYFATLEQCRASVSGVGGFCTDNPWYNPLPPPKPRKVRRHLGAAH